MLKLMTAFEQYLINTKKVSHNTFLAYTKDACDFFQFLRTRGTSPEKLCAQDLTSFLATLREKKMSSSTAHRKKTALKSLCHFMHHELKLPDYSDVLILRTSFPLLCDEAYVQQTINVLKEQTSFHALQKATILSLLLTGKIRIKQLLSLQISNMRAFDGTVSLGSHTVTMPPDFFILLTRYIETLPASSTTLFPCKVGTVIQPLSRAGLWSMLKTIQPVKPAPREILTPSFEQLGSRVGFTDSSKKIRDIYKKSHPRS